MASGGGGSGRIGGTRRGQTGNGGAAVKAGNHAGQKVAGSIGGNESDRVKTGLQSFASKDQLNKDVLLLALQGLNDRQMATNLEVGRGTIQARIIAANKILGNDGGTSARTLGESLKALKRR